VVRDLITIVFSFAWLALLIFVIVDVIRRRDISRKRKVAWIVGGVFVPILFVVVYVIANAKRIGDRLGFGHGSAEPKESTGSSEAGYQDDHPTAD
jgi:hypothetical protein